MFDADDPRANRLLAALAGGGQPQWWPRLEPLALERGQVLYESGSTQSHLCFPTSAIVSLLYVTEDGASMGTAIVGNEGVVGISVLLGSESAIGRGEVSIAGKGFRVRAQAVKDEFNRCGSATALLLRYTQALISQTAQTAVCNRHHTLAQRLCRWLLLNLDRQQGRELAMTHELIADSLGVRREGVTEAAHHLQAAGLIHCAYGHISVLDRRGLEQSACECYAVVKREYARLLPEPWAVQPCRTALRSLSASDRAGTSRARRQEVESALAA